MKHKGSFEDLKTMVRGVGREIVSANPSGNACQIKTEDGAILNWYESTGTVQFQGKPEAKSKLEADLATYTGIAAPASMPIPVNTQANGQSVAQTSSSKVFVVHGHDSAAREQLANKRTPILFSGQDGRATWISQGSAGILPAFRS